MAGSVLAAVSTLEQGLTKVTRLSAAGRMRNDSIEEPNDSMSTEVAPAPPNMMPDAVAVAPFHALPVMTAPLLVNTPLPASPPLAATAATSPHSSSTVILMASWTGDGGHRLQQEKMAFVAGQPSADERTEIYFLTTLLAEGPMNASYLGRCGTGCPPEEFIKGVWQGELNVPLGAGGPFDTVNVNPLPMGLRCPRE